MCLSLNDEPKCHRDWLNLLLFGGLKVNYRGFFGGQGNRLIFLGFWKEDLSVRPKEKRV